jgi:hypothetical protein
MKNGKVLAVLVLALGLMIWSGSVASGAQYLTINGQDINLITLKVGQSCDVEVVSDNNESYTAYVGFDDCNSLGIFSNRQTTSHAGDMAYIVEYNTPVFCGYDFGPGSMDPNEPSPGVQFVFQYEPDKVGHTILKLYDDSGMLEIDSVQITIEASVETEQHLSVDSGEPNSITLSLGQSCHVEVVSGSNSPYEACVGFDVNSLGSFSHLRTMLQAGDMADVNEINEPNFYGYYVRALGTANPPSSGIQFAFQYVAEQAGETILKLYDKTRTIEKDSVNITNGPSEKPSMGTGFTYQGRLTDANGTLPAHGWYDFKFSLYDNSAGGNLKGSPNTIEKENVEVDNGYFKVELDFGSDAFNGDARWLEIAVRKSVIGSDPNEHEKLSPRQRVAPSPYAIWATNAANAARADHAANAAWAENARNTTCAGLKTSDGEKPIQVYQYRGIGNQVDVELDISADCWTCGIFGFRTKGGNIDQSHGDEDIVSLFLYANDVVGNKLDPYKWHLRANLKCDNEQEDWYVNIMCITNEWVEWKRTFPNRMD